MKTEILLQGEHIPDIEIIQIGHDEGAEKILAAAAKHRSCEVEGDFHVFLEDHEEALPPGSRLSKGKDGQPIRLHVHRCHRVEVTVTFNGVTKEHEFGPGKTIASLKKWATNKAFEMDAGDAAEHVLQLAGTTDRPESDTHIGSLATCPDCHLDFDLVPLKRVEG